ncbi:MAG TPA: nitrous oxide reductase accessory protein NosL [Bacteroidia bacterium]|nr:nitrous oxide reductase accessory protein NosL [Bacteroidia bacterium]
MQLTKSSRIIIAIAALSLIVTNFVPLWRIELNAPQYPEGLTMEIWTFKLAGDVDVINGLNHYIGMSTMHSEDFIEFTILPYLIGFTIVFGLIVAIAGKKGPLYTYASWVILFGIVAMADFYKWEYDYGHHLNPNAPIQVPGMTYQPPFIGFKQLLNFGAFSIPDIGGFIFILNALLVVAVTFFIWKTANKKRMISYAAPILFLTCLSTLSGCSIEPKPIAYGKDPCEFCRMTIMDNKFGGEILTKTGKAYKFDDAKCLTAFIQREYVRPEKIAKIYLTDFKNGNLFIAVPSTVVLYNINFKSPMAGNIAAFEIPEELNQTQHQLGGSPLTWMEASNKLKEQEARIGL